MIKTLRMNRAFNSLAPKENWNLRCSNKNKAIVRKDCYPEIFRYTAIVKCSSSTSPGTSA